MSGELLRRLVLAKKDGADVRAVLSDILHEKCEADGRVCGLAFMSWVLATLLFVGAVVGLVAGDDLRSIPMLGALDDGHLKAIATGCGIVSSVLFVFFLRLRQEQTKHTFLLILVMDGSVKDAAALLFGGAREGKGSLALDATDAVLEVLS